MRDHGTEGKINELELEYNYIAIDNLNLKANIYSYVYSFKAK